MSSPEQQPVDPLPIDPPDNTNPDSTTQNPDLALADEEANLGLTDPPPPAINPPDNT
jgi:hypothetical protein